MVKNSPLKSSDLKIYESIHNETQEDLALQTRGDFLRAFPLKSLQTLTLKKYIIGLQSPTFCDYVEAKTRFWAAIVSSTAIKFGIYFGKAGNDKQKAYRFSKKFGRNEKEAFAAVKVSLLNLVSEGAKHRPNFQTIDGNPLSQMFKAKILSLYFPNRFLNVCSSEHLEMLVPNLGLKKV